MSALISPPLKLVILDRDGVINVDSEHYIRSPDDWHFIPGSIDAIALLNQKGYTLSIATNQSGLARGYYDEAMLEAIHQRMHWALATVGAKIDSIFYCPHGPEEACLCRKPKPGLLHQIAAHYQTTLTQVPFVGDSFRDIEAALNAGAKPRLVLTGNGEKTRRLHAQALENVPCYTDLWSFATNI